MFFFLKSKHEISFYKTNIQKLKGRKHENSETHYKSNAIVYAMISIAIAHGLTITNVENIMTDVIAYLKDNATVKK